MQSRALPQLRYDRGERALNQAQAYVLGDPLRDEPAVDRPEPGCRSASWEFDLALCLLEGGIPLADANHRTGAADHFVKALTLVPDFTLRPVIAYYLEKLRKSVPPSSAEQDKEKSQAAGEKKPAEDKS